MSTTRIQHEPAAHRFTAWVEAQAAGELDYELAQGSVVFTHTGVRPELRGTGIAAELVEAGLRWAREQGLAVVPACSYVAAYLRRLE
ncbi:MAG TPA: GNAT family N-acetyltransferase [Burkholderiaceae bacterium]